MAHAAPSDGDRLDELVVRALAELEAGGEEGLARFCRDHAEHADALRARIGALRAVGLLDAPNDKPPDRLGAFRLLRPLGAGGMGVVYLAVQEDLGREVALKIIRPEHMYFPGARKRFRREVEIVARLQHPGIVPIHTVGEENGIPYFAMDLLRGETIAAVLERVSKRDLASLTGADLALDASHAGYLFEGSWEEACARVIQQSAEALEHAHQRGVVHRDIKPSNILIASEGASRAVLFDFGLAVVSDTGDLTRTGARMGSLKYMSPEQARGETGAVGPLSDVYSLGATLYEMLTLRAAIEGRSETDVLRAIELGGARRLRELNPKASWEVETICMTAMELDPARRYASAADLARDLGNLLAHRPIEARRVGSLRRVRRFIERSPARAAAIALGGALIVGVPSLLAWQEHRSGVVVAAQRDQAQLNFERALAAVDRMLVHVGDVDLRFVPRLEPVRRAVLEDAVKLLTEFAADESNSGRARVEAAKAQARLGDLFFDLGRNSEGVQAFERAAAEYATLASEKPGDARLRDSWLIALGRQAELLVACGRGSEALAIHERIDQLIAAAPAVAQDASSSRRSINNALGRARALAATDNGVASLAALRDAAERADALVGEYGDDLDTLLLAQTCWNELGAYQLRRTETGQANVLAIAALERSVELAREIVDRAPGSPVHDGGLAQALNNLAGAVRRAEDVDRAQTLCEEARVILERLVAQYPDTLSNKLQLATIANQLALTHDQRAEYVLAEPLYRRAIELLRELVAAAPDDAVLWSRLGQSLANLASPVGHQGDLDAAIALVHDALDAQGKACERVPDNAEFRSAYIGHCQMLSVICREKGDWSGSAAAFETAIAAAPQDAHVRWNAMRACVAIVEALRTDTSLADDERERLVDGYVERAVAHMRRSVELGRPVKSDLHEFQDPKPLYGTAAFERYAAEWLQAHAANPSTPER
jgi:serine/threonine protein kinase/tetratricopeptide (TPR) repeat protein